MTADATEGTPLPTPVRRRRPVTAPVTPNLGALPVALVGLPGSGKSTVARLLAERLGWRWVDLDDRIEAVTGQSIPELFERGEDHFRNRNDNDDLTLKLRQQGYDVVYSLADLKKSESKKIAGLLAKEHMPSVAEGRKGILPEMVKKAIDVLSRDEAGFFLMVEGSMIDWGAHEKNLEYAVSELIDMDEAIGVAKKFAEKNGETLIVVTADHETGGCRQRQGRRRGHRQQGDDQPAGLADDQAALVDTIAQRNEK